MRYDGSHEKVTKLAENRQVFLDECISNFQTQNGKEK